MIHHNFRTVWRGVLNHLNKWDEEKVRAVKQIALQALTDAVTISPVDKGFYRSAHTLSIQEPVIRVPESPEDQGSTIERGRQALGKVTPQIIRKGLKIFLSNGIAYAQALEDGWSEQAPQGVYGIVRRRAQNRLNRVFRKAA